MRHFSSRFNSRLNSRSKSSRLSQTRTPASTSFNSLARVRAAPDLSFALDVASRIERSAGVLLTAPVLTHIVSFRYETPGLSPFECEKLNTEIARRLSARLLPAPVALRLRGRLSLRLAVTDAASREFAFRTIDAVIAVGEEIEAERFDQEFPGS